MIHQTFIQELLQRLRRLVCSAGCLHYENRFLSCIGITIGSIVFAFRVECPKLGLASKVITTKVDRKPMKPTARLFIVFSFTISTFCSSARAVDRFVLPASEEGLPGEGALRRYDGYVKKWGEFRSAWSKRVQQDQKAVVFLGDSITQGWGAKFKDKFPGMKLANRGIGGDTTRGMLIRLQQDVLSLNPSAIVLLLGTNDIEVGIDAAAIGRNFEKIIQAHQES